MGKETIMLAKPVAPKLIDPQAKYMISEKIDGQPAHFVLQEDGSLMVESRQGKPITSVSQKLLDDVVHYLTMNGIKECSGELYVPLMGSAEISGLVRKDEVCEELELNLFPHQPERAQPTTDMRVLDHILVSGEVILDAIDETGIIRLFQDNGSFDASSTLGEEIATKLEMVNDIQFDSTDRKYIEGFIAYKVDEPWVAGKRSSGYIKLIQDPTIDLLVVGVEEARTTKDQVDEDGNILIPKGTPLGRVGAFICKWGNGTCKVGSGKLSHKGAKYLWDRIQEGRTRIVEETTVYMRTKENGDSVEVTQYPMIIEVKYKVDAKYTSPRQPTFQRFRYDKDTYQTSFEE